MSQQGVSNQVRRLEELVGESLFQRHGAGVAPTTAGQALLELAEDVLASVDRLFDESRKGPIRIRVGEIRGRRMMQDAWSLHRGRHPDHEFSFRDMVSDEQIQAILAGDIDVGMARLSLSEPISGIASRPLRLDPLRALFYRPLEDQQLRTSPLGFQAADDGRFKSWHRYCAELGNSLNRDFVAVPHHITMLDLIGQGQIRGEIPPMLVMEGMREYPGSESFVFHAFTDLQPYYPWSLIWRKDERRIEVRQFIGSALMLARSRRWLTPDKSDVPAWLPDASWS